MVTKIKKELESILQREIEDHEVVPLFIKEIFGSKKIVKEYIRVMKGEANDNSKELAHKFECEFEILSNVIE